MDETIKILLIVCPMVFLGGFVDSVAGGGGLISLPAYLAAGVSPHVASATNKCSAVFGTLISTLKFMKERKIHYYTAVTSAVAALLGSYIGATLNHYLDEKYLKWVMVFVIPVIAILVMVKKDFGEANTIEQLSTQKTLVFSISIGFGIGMYDGFIGPGTGTFLILCYCTFMHFDIVTASGNAKVVNLASNLAAFVTFAVHGSIRWRIGLIAALFGIAGNYIGASLALKNGKKIIRPLFIVVLIALLVKITYDFM